MRELPPSFLDLAENFSDYRNITIEFGEKIKECETQFDPKMWARLVDVKRTHDGMVNIILNDSDYSNHNDQFASHDYFDKEHNPCLTAKEAGYYQSPAAVYFMESDSPADFFSIVTSSMVPGLGNALDALGLRIALDALRASVAPLTLLGDFIGNEHDGKGASGIAPFDRCAIIGQVKDAISLLEQISPKT